MQYVHTDDGEILLPLFYSFAKGRIDELFHSKNACPAEMRATGKECVATARKKLRQNIQKAENALRELVRRAGEAKGLSIGSTVNEPGKH